MSEPAQPRLDNHPTYCARWCERNAGKALAVLGIVALAAIASVSGAVFFVPAFAATLHITGTAGVVSSMVFGFTSSGTVAATMIAIKHFAPGWWERNKWLVFAFTLSAMAIAIGATGMVLPAAVLAAHNLGWLAAMGSKCSQGLFLLGVAGMAIVATIGTAKACQERVQRIESLKVSL